MKEQEVIRGFEANIDKWADTISFFRFYPDLWWDLITPESGGIRLHLDQRVFLRCIARFFSTYGVFPRGYGKTMLEVMGMLHAAVFYPKLKLSMTAQTKENSAKIIKEKYDELVSYYPLFRNELIGEPKFGDDKFEAHFVSGSKIDILANAQSSKGSRRNRMNIEEAALLNAALYEDVLEPIVIVKRQTVGKNMVINPEELHGQINFFTTSGYRGTDEFKRSLGMVKDMAELKGKIVLGSDWQLAVSYGRGDTKGEIMEKKEKLAPVFFAQNYESKWVGAIEGALVDMGRVLSLRTLAFPELKGVANGEYVIAMDVARSQNASNNQSSIVILKIKRSKGGRITRVQVVNIINLPTGLTYEAQTIELKKIAYLFNPIAVVVDGNGVGSGIIDECIKEHIDPDNGQVLPAWKPMNTDQEATTSDAEELLFNLKSQGINHDIIVNFINYIEASKLELLKINTEKDYDIHNFDYYQSGILPYVQTDFLMEEISNLKTKTNQNNKLSVEQQTRKTDKDRWSALVYGLYYIKNYIEDGEYTSNHDASEYLFIN